MLHLREVTDVSKCLYGITELWNVVCTILLRPTLVQGCTNYPKNQGATSKLQPSVRWNAASSTL